VVIERELLAEGEIIKKQEEFEEDKGQRAKGPKGQRARL